LVVAGRVVKVPAGLRVPQPFYGPGSEGYVAKGRGVRGREKKWPGGPADPGCAVMKLRGSRALGSPDSLLHLVTESTVESYTATDVKQLNKPRSCST
jgi:hypothetical protein